MTGDRERARRTTGTALALLALILWALFGFAGAYRWTQVPLIAGALGLVLVVRPAIARRDDRALDLGLVACLVAALLQLIPLPTEARSVLSPAADGADAALRVGTSLAPGLRATSLDPTATTWAIGLAFAFVLTFWASRAIVERGGLRPIYRGLAFAGLALAAIAFVQRAYAPRLVFGLWGFWTPITRTTVPSPVGPFVNRNDFATWVVLALPLVAGYGLARLDAQRRGLGRRWTAGAIERALDAWTVVVAGSVVLMTASLVACLSRSGLAGGITGFLVLVGLARPRLGIRRSWVMIAAGAAALAVALQFTNLDALAVRLSDSLPDDARGRMTIWHSTWSMIRDFAHVGVGLGAFERGMLVYQQGPRELFFNHAHNEYLQLAAEGGWLVGVPMLWTVAAWARLATRRTLADRSPTFWMRAGALAAISGVAVQSLGDTGLRMPASAVLFALAAAVGGRGERA